MNVEERRRQILKILYLRGHETVPNLSIELGVSARTIFRDIYALSLTEPIYTMTGRYTGGVYIMPGYLPSAFYFKDSEIQLLSRIILILEKQKEDSCVVEVLEPFKDLIASYTKPNYKEGLQK